MSSVSINRHDNTETKQAGQQHQPAHGYPGQPWQGYCEVDGPEHIGHDQCEKAAFHEAVRHAFPVGHGPERKPREGEQRQKELLKNILLENADEIPGYESINDSQRQDRKSTRLKSS